MVWLIHHVKFWAPLPIFKIKKEDRIGRKGLCCVGGAPFCNTMLNDGVRETACAIVAKGDSRFFSDN
jgi:hypothetical protein